MYIHRHISVNSTTIEPFPFLREIAMEAYLIENESILALNIELKDVIIVESEVTLVDGRVDKNTDGRIDILAKYGQEYLAVVELKKGELNENHLRQLESYLQERQQILSKFPNIWDATLNPVPQWIGIMIGESIQSDLMLKIRNGYFYDANIPIAALTINRYRCKEGNAYIITDTYFPTKIISKDYTQYLFNGKTYGKGRLVLAVLKQYVQEHRDLTFSQLESAFPQSLQGRSVFTTFEIAMKTYNDSKRKRNFIESEDLITLADNVTIAVSREWGSSNIGELIDHAASLGYKIL